MKTKLILAEQDDGVHVDGANFGPQKIVFPSFQDKDMVIVPKKEHPKEKERENKEKNFTFVNEFNEHLYQEVKHAKENNFLPITIGGDHSIAISSCLASIQIEKDLGLLWIDAHGDFNTFETTITGNIHGLPFATITGQNGKRLTFFHEGAFYDPKDCVLIGARDLDPKEVINLKQAGVTIFTTEDVHQKEISSLLEQAFSIATKNKKKVHISYDIDVIDPTICMGVSVPAKDGITKEEAQEILSDILDQKEKIASFDLVEYNPLRDKDDQTVTIAKEFLKQIITTFEKEAN